MSIQVCLIQRMNFDYKESSGKKALFANPKHQYRVSEYKEHDCSTNNKKNWDCYKCPSLPYFTDKLSLWGKWWKEWLFLQIQSINILHPNVENMVVMLITKRMEIIMSAKVCPISWMNFDYTKNDGNKAFLANRKNQHRGSQ